MVRWGRVLVADKSAVFRDVMRRVLAPHSDAVDVAATYTEALAAIERSPGVELVLVDADLPGGDGLELLTTLEADPRWTGAVIVMATKFSEIDAARARSLGAIGVVSKPVTFRDIGRAWHLGRGARFCEVPRAQRESLGRAQLAEQSAWGVQHVAWELHDLSISGALLDTEGPIAIDTEMDLALCLGAHTAYLTARVVRVQTPAWGVVGGVAVRFTRLTPEARDTISRYLERRAEMKA